MRRALMAGLLLLAQPPAAEAAKDYRTTVQRRGEFLQQLKRDISKIDKSIVITKELIARSKGEKYLADLNFRLAELYVAKSRLLYFKVLEEAGVEDKRSITAPEARLLKDQAIQTYRRILREFPDYPDNDKIRFYIAHELRELGEFEQMIKEYQLLVEQYPESDLRVEAWLVLGDYYFDKADLDQAEVYYRKIIDSPESYVHNLARYKLAWAHINRERCKEALGLFEKVVTSENVEAQRAVQVDSQSRMNVRREALVDSAFCYTEVKKPQDAVLYYRRLASSRQDYLAAIEKLARRYTIKGDPGSSAMLYREAMAVSNDVEHNMELAFKIYEMVQQSKRREDTDRDVELLIGAAARYRYSWRGSDQQREETLNDVELITRDLATKLQLEAQQKNNPKLHAKAARAYKAYLSLFSESPAAMDMTWNFAEAQFESGQHVEAGRTYEKLVRIYDVQNPRAAPVAAAAPPPAKGAPAKGGKAAVPAAKVPEAKKAGAPAAPKTDVAKVVSAGAGGAQEGERKKALYSAVVAYFEAIKRAQTLSRLDQTLAREGIKNLGARYVEEYPKDENTPQVKFNVARAYYEQGELKKSFELFYAFANEYPGNKDALAAANLSMDALSQLEDFTELAKRARELAKNERLGDKAFRDELVAMAGSADQSEINKRTIEAEGNLQVALKDIIQEKKGTEMAAKALYQAFAVAKDRRDVASMEQVGKELAEEYPDSQYTQTVLPALGEAAIQAGEFEKGAGYYEEFSRRFARDKAAPDLLFAAAELRLALGDRSAAMTMFEKLAQIQPDQAKRADIMMRASRAAFDARNYRRAAEVAAGLFGDKDRGVPARALAGEAYFRSGDEAQAARLLQEAALAGARGEGGAEGREAASRAQFLLGEVLRKEWEPIQFGSGQDDNAVLEAKFTRLSQMEELYAGAVQLGDPDSAIGALYRLAHIYRSTADMLDNAPMPAGLSADDQKAYKAALAERSGPMRTQADEYLKACKQKAVELKVFTHYTKGCLTGASVTDELPQPPPRPSVEIPGAAELRNKLRSNPKDFAALVELGRKALGVGDFYAASVIFNRAEELNENSAEVQNALGVTAYATGRPQEAYFLFQKAAKLEPAYAPAQHNLALMYAEYGDQKHADEARKAAAGSAGSGPEIIRPAGGG
ncbi:MAG: tetratricopeptide repeat protein [Deltaproteobacteria bacterium]|nr:tetratricopeptide repeat protein [Deltaproteobacteria bacterium]